MARGAGNSSSATARNWPSAQAPACRLMSLSSRASRASRSLASPRRGGTFRWISGGSASSAYRIKTPNGTLGIRGTALDVTIRDGRVYVALINGSAKFCSGSSCRTLKKSCDFIVADGRKISEPAQVSTATTKQETAAQLFPYLANPSRLSSRFRVGGGNCLGRLASVGKGKATTAVA